MRKARRRGGLEMERYGERERERERENIRLLAGVRVYVRLGTNACEMQLCHCSHRKPPSVLWTQVERPLLWLAS